MKIFIIQRKGAPTARSSHHGVQTRGLVLLNKLLLADCDILGLEGEIPVVVVAQQQPIAWPWPCVSSMTATTIKQYTRYVKANC
jgi:hypothetical protein